MAEDDLVGWVAAGLDCAGSAIVAGFCFVGCSATWLSFALAWLAEEVVFAGDLSVFSATGASEPFAGTPLLSAEASSLEFSAAGASLPLS